MIASQREPKNGRRVCRNQSDPLPDRGLPPQPSPAGDSEPPPGQTTAQPKICGPPTCEAPKPRNRTTLWFLSRSALVCATPRRHLAIFIAIFPSPISLEHQDRRRRTKSGGQVAEQSFCYPARALSSASTRIATGATASPSIKKPHSRFVSRDR
jgi:hypothetical protein